MYKAVVCRLERVSEHEKLNNLNIATFKGNQVLVSKEAKVGTLGIFFPSDGTISDMHLRSNQLYRKMYQCGDLISSYRELVGRGFVYDKINRTFSRTFSDSTDVYSEIPGKGFFEDNGRVRVVAFQGVESDGFWHPIEGYFDYMVYRPHKFKDGEELSWIGGLPLCEKYMTPATLKAIKNGVENEKKTKKKIKIEFPEHYDTSYINNAIIEPGTSVIITEKLHGTSGRTGYVEMVRSRFMTFLSKLFRLKTHIYVSGTRRTIMPYKTKSKYSGGFYPGTNFRQTIHDKIVSLKLMKGEVLYYEIVGYSDKDRLIMAKHNITDKALKKKFGDTMRYTYGQDTAFEIYVYRITGNHGEYSWQEVKDRCKELGLNHVPELATITYTTQEEFKELYVKLANDRSSLDNRHIREGLCFRWDKKWYKYKSYLFRDLEGISKNSDEYVDPEEIS